METQAAAGPNVPPPYAPPPYGAVPVRQRTPLRDVVLGWRAALAVLVAGLILGGLGGAGLMAIIDHHGGGRTSPGGFGRLGPQGGFGGRSFGQPGTNGSGGSGGFGGSIG